MPGALPLFLTEFLDYPRRPASPSSCYGRRGLTRIFMSALRPAGVSVGAKLAYPCSLGDNGGQRARDAGVGVGALYLHGGLMIRASRDRRDGAPPNAVSAISICERFANFNSNARLFAARPLFLRDRDRQVILSIGRGNPVLGGRVIPLGGKFI